MVQQDNDRKHTANAAHQLKKNTKLNNLSEFSSNIDLNQQLQDDIKCRTIEPPSYSENFL